MPIKREDLPPVVQQLLRKSADTGKIGGLRNNGQAVWDAVYYLVNEAFLLGVSEGRGAPNNTLSVDKYYKLESGDIVKLVCEIEEHYPMYKKGYRFQDHLGNLYRLDGSYLRDDEVEEPEPQEMLEISREEYKALNEVRDPRPIPEWWQTTRNEK